MVTLVGVSFSPSLIIALSYLEKFEEERRNVEEERTREREDERTRRREERRRGKAERRRGSGGEDQEERRRVGE